MLVSTAVCVDKLNPFLAGQVFGGQNTRVPVLAGAVVVLLAKSPQMEY